MPTPHDEPSVVTKADGEVLIDGPDGMTSSMTPEAALETARRLGNVAVDVIVERAQQHQSSTPGATPPVTETEHIEDDGEPLGANFA